MLGEVGALRPVVPKPSGGIRFDVRDAHQMMLAHRSLGHATIGHVQGTKN